MAADLAGPGRRLSTRGGPSARAMRVQERDRGCPHASLPPAAQAAEARPRGSAKDCTPESACAAAQAEGWRAPGSVLDCASQCAMGWGSSPHCPIHALAHASGHQALGLGAGPEEGDQGVEEVCARRGEIEAVEGSADPQSACDRRCTAQGGAERPVARAVRSRDQDVGASGTQTPLDPPSGGDAGGTSWRDFKGESEPLHQSVVDQGQHQEKGQEQGQGQEQEKGQEQGQEKGQEQGQERGPEQGEGQKQGQGHEKEQEKELSIFRFILPDGTLYKIVAEDLTAGQVMHAFPGHTLSLSPGGRLQLPEETELVYWNTYYLHPHRKGSRAASVDVHHERKSLRALRRRYAFARQEQGQAEAQEPRQGQGQEHRQAGADAEEGSQDGTGPGSPFGSYSIAALRRSISKPRVRWVSEEAAPNADGYMSDPCMPPGTSKKVAPVPGLQAQASPTRLFSPRRSFRPSMGASPSLPTDTAGAPLAHLSRASGSQSTSDSGHEGSNHTLGGSKGSQPLTGAHRAKGSQSQTFTELCSFLRKASGGHLGHASSDLLPRTHSREQILSDIIENPSRAAVASRLMCRASNPLNRRSASNVDARSKTMNRERKASLPSRFGKAEM